MTTKLFGCAFAVASLALAVGCSSADSGGEPEPTGTSEAADTYGRSCYSCSRQGSELYCICKEGNGSELLSRIDTSRCRGRSIDNQHGCLQCGNVRGEFSCSAGFYYGGCANGWEICN